MREIHDLYIHGDLIKYFERYPKERDWWKKEFVREFLEKWIRDYNPYWTAEQILKQLEGED